MNEWVLFPITTQSKPAQCGLLYYLDHVGPTFELMGRRLIQFEEIIFKNEVELGGKKF